MAFRLRNICYVCNEAFRVNQIAIFRENADKRRVAVKRRNELRFPEENLIADNSK